MGYPDGKGCVFLSKSLTCLHPMTKEAANIPADGKLDDTYQQAGKGDKQDEENSTVGMADVLDGGACDYHQRACPHVISKVTNTDDTTMKAVHIVLYHIRQQHWYKQHGTYAIGYLQEGSKEGDVCRVLQDGEADRDKHGSDEVGEEGIGGHLLQRASELLGDDSCGGSRRTNDDGKQCLGQYQGVALEAKRQHDSHDDTYEEHLEESHPPVPRHWTQLTEVNLTEGDKEYEEHEQWQDGIEDRCKKVSRPSQGRGVSKKEIDKRAYPHCYWKSPVLYKSKYGIHS